MKNDQKSSSRWLLQVPLLMGVCFLNAHAGLPLKDNVDVDKQLSQADPFGFGKFLKSKHNGAQARGGGGRLPRRGLSAAARSRAGRSGLG